MCRAAKMSNSPLDVEPICPELNFFVNCFGQTEKLNTNKLNRGHIDMYRMELDTLQSINQVPLHACILGHGEWPSCNHRSI